MRLRDRRVMTTPSPSLHVDRLVTVRGPGNPVGGPTTKRWSIGRDGHLLFREPAVVRHAEGSKRPRSNMRGSNPPPPPGKPRKSPPRKSPPPRKRSRKSPPPPGNVGEADMGLATPINSLRMRSASRALTNWQTCEKLSADLSPFSKPRMSSMARRGLQQPLCWPAT